MSYSLDVRTSAKYKILSISIPFVKYAIKLLIVDKSASIDETTSINSTTNLAINSPSASKSIAAMSSFVNTPSAGKLPSTKAIKSSFLTSK